MVLFTSRNCSIPDVLSFSKSSAQWKCQITRSFHLFQKLVVVFFISGGNLHFCGVSSRFCLYQKWFSMVSLILHCVSLLGFRQKYRPIKVRAKSRWLVYIYHRWIFYENFFCILQSSARARFLKYILKMQRPNTAYAHMRSTKTPFVSAAWPTRLGACHGQLHSAAKPYTAHNRRLCRWNDLKRTLLKVYPSCTIINVVQSAYIHWINLCYIKFIQI